MLLDLRFRSFETQLKPVVDGVHTFDPNEVRLKLDPISVPFRGDPRVNQSRVEELLCEKNGAPRRVWEQPAKTPPQAGVPVLSNWSDLYDLGDLDTG